MHHPRFIGQSHFVLIIMRLLCINQILRLNFELIGEAPCLMYQAQPKLHHRQFHQNSNDYFSLISGSMLFHHNHLHHRHLRWVLIRSWKSKKFLDFNYFSKPYSNLSSDDYHWWMENSLHSPLYSKLYPILQRECFVW